MPTAYVEDFVSRGSGIPDTKDKILQVAEGLFAENGFKATSLRMITKAAEVNIASVNYHFGSKDDLIIELIRQGIRPLNQDRFRLLDEFEQEAKEKGERLTIERVLEAFYRPAFTYFIHESKRNFLRVLGRCLYEDGAYMDEIMEKDWQPLCERFLKGFCAALDMRPEHFPQWRFHFALGAMIQTFNPVTLGMIQEVEPEKLLSELIAFSAAGMQSEPKRGEAL
ncbi:MAG: TetR/AcrR family transcriptional regulator [Verrucomicrobiota bacterium]